MSSPARRLSGSLAELKRRKVYRVTAIYVVMAAAGLELASVLLPSTRLPPWFDELFLGIAIGVLCLGGIGMFIIREWRTAR